MLVRIDSDRFGLLRNGSVRFGLTAQERGSASAETFQWENAGKHGEKRESVGNGTMEYWKSGMMECWNYGGVQRRRAKKSFWCSWVLIAAVGSRVANHGIEDDDDLLRRTLPPRQG